MIVDPPADALRVLRALVVKQKRMLDPGCWIERPASSIQNKSPGARANGRDTRAPGVLAWPELEGVRRDARRPGRVGRVD